MSRHSKPEERYAPIEEGAFVQLKYSHPEAVKLGRSWAGKEVGWVIDITDDIATVTWNDGETLQHPLYLLVNV